MSVWKERRNATCSSVHRGRVVDHEQDVGLGRLLHLEHQVHGLPIRVRLKDEGVALATCEHRQRQHPTALPRHSYASQARLTRPRSG